MQIPTINRRARRRCTRFTNHGSNNDSAGARAPAINQQIVPRAGANIHIGYRVYGTVTDPAFLQVTEAGDTADKTFDHIYEDNNNQRHRKIAHHNRWWIYLRSGKLHAGDEKGADLRQHLVDALHPNCLSRRVACRIHPGRSEEAIFRRPIRANVKHRHKPAKIEIHPERPLAGVASILIPVLRCCRNASGPTGFGRAALPRPNGRPHRLRSAMLACPRSGLKPGHAGDIVQQARLSTLVGVPTAMPRSRRV